MSIFVVLGLLICVAAKDTNSGTRVFVQTGKDLFLPVKEPVALGDVNDFTWKLNGSKNIAKLSPNNKTTIHKSYAGRAEFSVQSCSFLLKSVEKTDSGSYTAYISGDQDLLVAEYEVTVLDPVSPANLTVDSVFNSLDSCSVTMSCSTQDSHISSTFTCDSNTCRQEGGERSEATSSGASLSVYLSNDSIICNHSNQVSWTKDIKMIEDFCPQHIGSQCVSAGISVCLVKTVVFSVSLIIMVSAVISVHVMERLKKRK